MARMTVGRVTTGLYLVPAAAILISLAWLGQIPWPTELAGGAIALAGVALATVQPASRRPVATTGRFQPAQMPHRAGQRRSRCGAGVNYDIT
jgi:hypothetical protein